MNKQVILQTAKKRKGFRAMWAAERVFNGMHSYMQLKGTVQRNLFFELTIDSETAQGPPTPCNVISILPLYLQRYSYLKIDSR